MGTRQLPSGAFQVRFQHNRASCVATYPTRELAEDAEVLMRAAALTRGHVDDHGQAPEDAHERSDAYLPTPDQVSASSSEASAVIDAVFTDFSLEGPEQPAVRSDDLLTTSQAAALLGVSRPTLVTWLEGGRIPYDRHGSHRKIRRSDVLAYRDRRDIPVLIPKVTDRLSPSCPSAHFR